MRIWLTPRWSWMILNSISLNFQRISRISQISDATTAKRMKIGQYCLRQRCKHVELEQFLTCFRVARVCQRQLGFLVFFVKCLQHFSARQHLQHAIKSYRPPVCPSVTQLNRSKTVEMFTLHGSGNWGKTGQCSYHEHWIRHSALDRLCCHYQRLCCGDRERCLAFEFRLWTLTMVVFDGGRWDMFSSLDFGVPLTGIESVILGVMS